MHRERLCNCDCPGGPFLVLVFDRTMVALRHIEMHSPGKVDGDVVFQFK